MCFRLLRALLRELRGSWRSRLVAVLRLPFTKDTATKSGLQYTRFRLKAEMTLLKSATLVLDSPRIVAQLATGRSSGRGLFRRPETRLFQAVGSGRELVIQPLLKGSTRELCGCRWQLFFT